MTDSSELRTPNRAVVPHILYGRLILYQIFRKHANNFLHYFDLFLTQSIAAYSF